MTTVILALAVPGLLAVMYLGLRRAQTTPLARSLAHARGDTRGIALQTVIIIVVLLAIAGAVAAVLLSRASDVTTDLERTDVTFGQVVDEASCESFSMGNEQGSWSSTTCTWTAAANGENPPDVSSGACRLQRGKYTAGTGSSKATCTLDTA